MLRGLLAIVVVAACSRKIELGTERSDCRGDSTCDPGLLCLSNLCVRPPQGDCAAVAELLASFDLGNYASAEARAPVTAKYRTACEQAHVTKDEADCMAKARDRWAAAQCAPRLFPELAASGTGDCAAVRAKIRASYGAQGSAFANDPRMSKWFDTTMVIVQQSCEQDKWPDAVKQCILAASGTDTNALTGCNQAMPPALQQKLQERMTAAMQAQQP